jgi:putative transposase
MPRKKLIRSDVLPYHVTARGNNREFFPGDHAYVWKLFNRQLSEASEKFGAKIHAFVLMPNHFHLLLSTPSQDLGVIMQSLMRSVTKTLNVKTGRSGRIFGARYNGSIITTSNYFDIALKYVYRNPVKAKLVSDCESYEYSTLRNIFGNLKLPYELRPPFEEQLLIPNNQPYEFLDWLNQPFRTENERDLRDGILKTSFSPRRRGWKKFEKSVKEEKFNAITYNK